MPPHGEVRSVAAAAPGPNATARLGAFAAERSSAPLLPEVRARAAGCLLDTLGVALAARGERTARALAGLAGPSGDGSSAARLWIDGRRAGLDDAVAANAALAHAHFHDDSCHSSWSHPGSLIVPLAVALGEAEGGDLDAVLRALVAGYAALAWLGADEAVARPLIRRGFRGSPVFGTIGAAVTAATAMGLDADRAAHAVAIAATTTGGVLEPVRAGSDEWRLQNARAAAGGLFAARAAAAGVEGAPDALEGPRGFLRAFAGLEAAPAVWSLPPSPDVMANAMTKPYATLGDNMAAVLAAAVLRSRLVERGVDPDRIRRVEVALWRPYTEYPGVAYRGPFATVIQALASAPFSVAAVLAVGELGFDVPERRRDDPALLRLVERVELGAHDGAYLDADVVVTLEDGTRLAARADESPRTRIFQDRATATEVLEARLARLGRSAGEGRAIADATFDAPAGAPLSGLLDRLIAPSA